MSSSFQAGYGRIGYRLDPLAASNIHNINSLATLLPSLLLAMVVFTSEDNTIIFEDQYNDNDDVGWDDDEHL